MKKRAKASKSRAAKPTAADLAAAARLRDAWETEKRRRRNAGLQQITQPMVGDVLDIGQSAVSQYMTGKIPLNYKAVMAFAGVLGISPEDIRSDLPEQALAGNPTGDQGDTWVDITAYGQGVAAGDGMTAEDYTETHSLKFKKSSLKRKGLFARKLSVFYASGDSMEPRILDGDALLFDESDTTPRDGAIYVVRYEGHLYVKRLERFGDQWFMTSDNGADPKWRKPIAVALGETLDIIGRVRWIGSWED